MATIPNSTTRLHHHVTSTNHHHRHGFSTRIRATLSDEENQLPRRKLLTTLLSASLALGLQTTPSALAQNWGVRSLMKERFFQPGLSPEDALARLRQSAEGLHDLRSMLDSHSWRYVIFYIRLKQTYLSQDMKTVMTLVPENKRKDYVEAANEFVTNMGQVYY